MIKKILGAVALIALVAAAIWYWFIRHDPVAEAQDLAEAEAAVELSAYPQQVLWGDTHLHTDNSIDPFGFGTRACARLSPLTEARATKPRCSSASTIATRPDRSIPKSRATSLCVIPGVSTVIDRTENMRGDSSSSARVARKSA